MTTLERRITEWLRAGKDLRGYCIVRIHGKGDTCKEFLVSNISVARERVAHYRVTWPLYLSATIAIHDGTTWVETR